MYKLTTSLYLGRINYQNAILCIKRRSNQISPSGHVVVSGIQATGQPHLGNYLGMIKPCVKLQFSTSISRIFLIVADLHALTGGSFNPSMFKTVLQLAATLMACGVEPLMTLPQSGSNKTVMFQQSAVRGHCELAWLLSSQCSVNRLSQLPQWRLKSKISLSDTTTSPPSCTESPSSVALFTYPLLQAADITLYGADVVPVGIDQAVHVELTRDVVRSTLAQYPALRDTLRLPELQVTDVPKVHNLRYPLKKMSKSVGPEVGTLWLLDNPDTIKMKIGRAQTDSLRSLSYEPEARPGVANLLRIYAAVKEISVEEATSLLANSSKVELKSILTDALIEELTPIQKRFGELIRVGYSDSISAVHKALFAGAKFASEIASKKLSEIYKAVGLSDSSSHGHLR